MTDMYDLLGKAVANEVRTKFWQSLNREAFRKLGAQKMEPHKKKVKK